MTGNPVVRFAPGLVLIYVLGVGGGTGDNRRVGPATRTLAAKTPKCGDQAMTRFAKRMVEFLRKEDGPTAVEYAVMLALIIVVCIAAITTLGTNASQTFSYVGQNTKPTSS
jgi:pilus assembly protein Flp/PilA